MKFAHRLVNALTTVFVFFIIELAKTKPRSIPDTLSRLKLSILIISTLSYLLGIGFQHWHKKETPDEG